MVGLGGCGDSGAARRDWRHPGARSGGCGRAWRSRTRTLFAANRHTNTNPDVHANCNIRANYNAKPDTNSDRHAKPDTGANRNSRTDAYANCYCASATNATSATNTAPATNAGTANTRAADA